MSSESRGTRMAGVLAGVDAALVVTALGIMYALIVYAAVGPQALPAALASTTTGLVVGGLAALAAGRTLGLVTGPTASGALVIGAMVQQLQGVAGAAGSVEAAVVATACAGFGAGAVQLLFARLNIGAALRFVPYPVLMGFANTVALSLIVSVVPVALGHAYMGRLVESPRWFDDWHPFAVVVAVSGAAAGWAAARRWSFVPGAFVAMLVATLVHHALTMACAACTPGPLLALGGAVQMADDAPRTVTGLMVDPAYWAAILQAIVVLAALNSLFSLLSGARLTQPHEPPVDGNALLRSQGVGNLASGLVLGLPVAILTSPSMAIKRASGQRATAMTTYFIATALVFACGSMLFRFIPMAAVASSVFVSARALFDASTWPLVAQLRRAGGRAARGPLAVAGLVVAFGLLRGMAAALFVGALAAACLLAFEMRRQVVLAVSDARALRSRRMRTAAQMERLQELGSRIRIVELGHWLYFGTADELGRILDDQHDASWLLLDARRVAGIDLTAARSLVNAAQRLRSRGVTVVLAGIDDDDPRREAIVALQPGPAPDALRVMRDIDDALEAAEDDLLGDTGPDAPDATATLLGLSYDDHARLQPCLQVATLRVGETLFRAGDPGDMLYVVRRGRITLWLGSDRQRRTRLVTVGPGTLFGEMALLDGRVRSADAVADHDSELLALSRGSLERLAIEDPKLHARILHGMAVHMAQRLRHTTTLVDRLAR